MPRRLREFFDAPSGDLRAVLLGWVLNIHLAIALALGLFYPGAPPNPSVVSYVALATIPPVLALRWMLRRGRLRAASWSFLLGLAALMLSVGMGIAGSVALASVGIPQMTLIVMAGLLLGGRQAIGFAVGMVLANGTLMAWEATHVPERGPALLSFWTLQAIFFCATGALLARAIWLTEAAFDRADRAAAERRAAEAALRDGMERYRLITSVSSDYVFSTELLADGGLRLNWVAGAFEAITGFSFDEYVARGGWRAALHPDDVAQDERDIASLRNNRTVASDLRTICRDGSVRWVRVYAHPVWNAEANELVGIYGAVQDIGDRKAAEFERERLIQELAARNSELERFTYAVSHDLKSPLITVRGFLGHIERSALAGDFVSMRADVERVQKATASMQQLLDDLLALSRAGRATKPPEDVSFEEMAKDALMRTHGRLAAAGVTAVVEPDLGSVRVDRDRIVTVLQNLVDNAVKFMGSQARPTVTIGARRRPSGREFFVRDNGIGVAPADRSRIFDLFHKLDPEAPGTGLGLALARRIVEAHAGRIWVESDGPAAGSTFVFTLGAP